MSKLRTWRTDRKFSQLDMAMRLGLGGARTYQRYESGERPAPATVVEAIFVLTNKEVGPPDMHDVRLNWIRLQDVAQEESKGAA